MAARPHGVGRPDDDAAADEPVGPPADDGHGGDGTPADGDERAGGAEPAPPDGGPAAPDGVPPPSADSDADVATPRAPGQDGALDVDQQWRSIVARLGSLDDDEEPAPAPPPERRVVRPAAAAPAGDSPDDPRAWAPDPAVEEAEDHFVPPDPGPVLGGDPLLTMAWVVVLAVPALLVLSVVLRLDLPGSTLQIGGALFALGLGALLWRMPRRGEDDDDGPGAVV